MRPINLLRIQSTHLCIDFTMQLSSTWMRLKTEKGLTFYNFVQVLLFNFFLRQHSENTESF